MLIKDIAARALRYVGRADLSSTVAGGGTPTGEGAEAVETLLYCINAVEDELARYYFPLEYTEKLYAVSGKYEFTRFTHTPVKVLKVTVDDKEIDFTVYPTYISAAENTATITYTYSPDKKSLSSESDYGDDVGEEIIACGAASEFCLLNGEAEAAASWESRYRFWIDRSKKTSGTGIYIPPRRWV